MFYLTTYLIRSGLSKGSYEYRKNPLVHVKASLTRNVFKEDKATLQGLFEQNVLLYNKKSYNILSSYISKYFGLTYQTYPTLLLRFS